MAVRFTGSGVIDYGVAWPSPRSEFTITAWFFGISGPGSIFEKSGSFSTEQIVFYLSGGGGTYVVAGGVSIGGVTYTPNAWNFVSYVSRQQFGTWVTEVTVNLQNPVQVNTGTTTTTNSLAVGGAIQTGITYLLDGIVDQFLAFDYALSDQELEELFYNRKPHRRPAAIAYPNFLGPVGGAVTSARDSSDSRVVTSVSGSGISYTEGIY